MTVIGFCYYLVVYLQVENAFRYDKISNDIRFDQEIWKNGTIRERGQMISFLLDSIGLIDKSKDKITALLGPPDREWSLDDGQYKSTLCYRVDRGHAFIYDMVIFFDSTNYSRNLLFDD